MVRCVMHVCPVCTAACCTAIGIVARYRAILVEWLIARIPWRTVQDKIDLDSP